MLNDELPSFVELRLCCSFASVAPVYPACNAVFADYLTLEPNVLPKEHEVDIEWMAFIKQLIHGNISVLINQIWLEKATDAF